MIKLSCVSYSYLNDITALSDVNLEIKKGERVVIIGSNGSGKSTLMKIISALIYPLSGKYFYKDREINLKTLKERDVHFLIRSEIAYLFEDSDIQLFSPTVYDELIFGPKQLGLPDEECKKRVEAVVEMLDISELVSRPSYTLSGGEKKKVAIASILTSNPELILFDEPLNNLDPRMQSFMIDLLIKLNEAGKTIIVTTHNPFIITEIDPSVVIVYPDHRVKKYDSFKAIDEAEFIKAELVYEHSHFHNGLIHKHPHLFFHNHNDIK